VRMSMRVFLTVSAVSILFATTVGQLTAGASMPQLTSTGSSFAGVAISQWEGQFNALDGGDVNFLVSSSVIGLNDFCSRTVDFAASDISYAAEQSACSSTQLPYPYQYIPSVGGGLGFEYNLTGTTGKPITNLVLTPPRSPESSRAPSTTGTIPPSRLSTRPSSCPTRRSQRSTAATRPVGITFCRATCSRPTPR